MDRQRIVASSRKHLKELIKHEMQTHGDNCDLNHIDVSQVENMSYVFHNVPFNGDISKWDVSNVKDMSWMFAKSNFNGDISNWNTKNVANMFFMFYDCSFRGDLTDWNVSSVLTMTFMFELTEIIKPYWCIEDLIARKVAVQKHILMRQIQRNAQQAGDDDPSITKI